MLPRKPEIEHALIPELDASVVAHQHLQLLKNERARWRCLLLPSLISVVLHLFLLPLLMVITVTFADEFVSLSTWEASADQLGDNTVGEIDFEREPDLAQSEEERTVAQGTEQAEELLAAPVPASMATEATAQLASQPKSAALYSTLGRVVSVTGSRITIQLFDFAFIDSGIDLQAKGSHLSFQSNPSTTVCFFGAGKRFPVEGGVGSLRSGNWVWIAYVKNDGQDIARSIDICQTADSGPAPQPATGGEPGAFKMSAEEQELFDFANDVRVKHGKKPMLANATLFNVARGYAALMVKKESVDVKLDGKDSLTRVMDAGYKAGDATTRHAFGSVIISVWKSHLETNVLYNFEETGIGIVKDKIGNAYCCWIFATPAK
jgi:hypothetical protein